MGSNYIKRRNGRLPAGYYQIKPDRAHRPVIVTDQIRPAFTLRGCFEAFLFILKFILLVILFSFLFGDVCK